ncbi:MAG: hypothetical protein M3Y57_01755 [Acidobacteriota bacterium]|nr:hypothetical protein [Acidobacteriota bacterium]
MSRRNYLNAKLIAIFTVLALTGAAVAQESTDSGNQKCSKHQYTPASLAGTYSVTGVFGSHAGGYVGTTDIDGKGVVSNNRGVVVDRELPAPLELSSPGKVTINPDGTGLFTENVSVVGGPSNVPYHFNFVVAEARLSGDKLIATRIVLLQQESSPLPNSPVFASFVYTRRPE